MLVVWSPGEYCRIEWIATNNKARLRLCPCIRTQAFKIQQRGFKSVYVEVRSEQTNRELATVDMWIVVIDPMCSGDDVRCPSEGFH